MKTKSKKTKEQIINSFENRFILTFISGAVWLLTLFSVVMLSADLESTARLAIVGIGFAVAMILLFFAIHCPICDSLKSKEYADAGIIKLETGFFRCETCSLSNKQIREYVDMLKRGVDIDAEAIARFNKRDL